MSNVECRMWSENALNPVKSLFSAYLIYPCAQEKEKKENEGQSDMGENNGANRKFPLYSNELDAPTPT